MDQHRFDHLTKSLAGGASRRSALKALAGAAAGGLAALVGGGVEAAPKSGGKPPCCPTGYNALCTTTAGPTCTDTKTDENNCGACGVVCPSGATCVNGVCEAADPTCTDGITNGDETDIDCGGTCPACVNDQTCLIDTDCQSGTCCGGVCATVGEGCNTGGAGICATGTTQCVDGAVVCAQTYQRQAEVCDGLDNDCDGQVDNGFDLQTDVNNCGACGTVCQAANATVVCADGACVISNCHPGYADCDGLYSTGCEVNLSTDEGNCGDCGIVCGSEATCEAGDCTQALSVSGLAVEPAAVPVGQSATGTVTLNTTAVADTVIALSVSPDTAASVQTSVTVVAGQTSATFPVEGLTPNDDVSLVAELNGQLFSTIFDVVA